MTCYKSAMRFYRVLTFQTSRFRSKENYSEFCYERLCLVHICACILQFFIVVHYCAYEYDENNDDDDDDDDADDDDVTLYPTI